MYYQPMNEIALKRRGRMIRAQAAGLIAGWLLLPCALADLPAAPKLDPERVGWTEIRMTATKLFVTARADIRLRTLPAAEVRDQLLPVPEGRPVAPGPEVLEIVYEGGGLGRRSRLTLLMDPVSGAALQRNQHDLEGRLRHRTYRLSDIGAYHRTRWPVGNEKSLPPAEWSETSEGLRPYPAEAAGHTILEPTGLLYAVAAAALDKPGDTTEFLMFQRRSVLRVSATVLEPREIRVNYDEIGPAGTSRRSGAVQPLRISLEGEPLDEDEDELELLGLRGSIELALEPQARVPLELTGNVKVMGRVTFRLASVHLK